MADCFDDAADWWGMLGARSGMMGAPVALADCLGVSADWWDVWADSFDVPAALEGVAGDLCGVSAGSAGVWADFGVGHIADRWNAGQSWDSSVAGSLAVAIGIVLGIGPFAAAAAAVAV